MKKHHLHAWLIFLLTAALDVGSCVAAEKVPPASPEVTAAMQPYLDSKRYLSHVAMEELRKAQNGNKVPTA